MRPLLTKPVLLLAVAFLAVGSVVQASIRHRRHHVRHDPPRARFTILGRISGPLWPGATQPIDIALTNRIRHVLWISDLRVTVAIDRAHVAAGCVAGRDFAVTQLPQATYPIRLPPRTPYTTSWPGRLAWPGGRGVPLRDLAVRALPTITLVNLPDVDQDGCKGAGIQLSFRATSRLHPPHTWVPTP